MDPRGLVAFIVTFHEVAALLGVLVGALITVLGLLLLRNVSTGRRLVTVGAFAVGAACVTFALTSRLLHVSAFDVEVVKVAE